MKTDRELLELAARAIKLDLTGYEWHDSPFYVGFMRRNFEPCGLELQSQSWNPLENSAEALGLAAILRLNIFHGGDHAVVVGKSGIQGHRCEEMVPGLGGIKATRRAIVLAAAELGGKA